MLNNSYLHEENKRARGRKTLTLNINQIKNIRGNYDY